MLTVLFKLFLSLCIFCNQAEANVARFRLEAEENVSVTDSSKAASNPLRADTDTVKIPGQKVVSSRGILDILENFRLWQIERTKDGSTTTSAPTPEPQGLDAYLLPRLPNVTLDAVTFGNVLTGLWGAAQDIGKSFFGPPPTEPDPDYGKNGTNFSTTIPPNELFCLFCEGERKEEVLT